MTLVAAKGDQRRVDAAIKQKWDHPGVCLAYYLSLSYLYYQLDISAASDEVYDKLAHKLLDWAERVGSREHSLLLAHPHARLLDVEALRAGTCYHITEYPQRTVQASIALAVTHGFLVDDTKPKPKTPRRTKRTK